MVAPPSGPGTNGQPMRLQAGWATIFCLAAHFCCFPVAIESLSQVARYAADRSFEKRSFCQSLFWLFGFYERP
jgi:hypothetical protein